MMKALKVLFVVVALLAIAAPFASAQDNRLNSRGRCIEEGGVYNYDRDGVQGIRVEAYAFNSAIIFSEYVITRPELEAAVLSVDEDGNTIAGDGFVGGEGDIQFWFSNNGTPADLSDDYATIIIRTANDPETDACLFVFSNFDNPVLTVLQQYPDGSTVIDNQDVWLNAGR